MSHQAVITGDIVRSRDAGSYAELLGTLKDVLEMVHGTYQGRFEIYRGDSFQILIPDVRNAVLAAILIRAHLISDSPSARNKLDARVSVGIGKHQPGEASITESWGEAFVLSGLGLDEISEGDGRLAIRTPSPPARGSLDLLTKFADDIISNWSPLSAEIAYYSLRLDASQLQLGEMLNKKQPTIHARIKRARLGLLEEYIDRVNVVFGQEGMT